ncbi:hypothetical protein GGF32_001808 [Allomyces javanicus]|nr:hypothetical protein GGF32_001808 [Allomyces javanicus]
MDPTAPPTDAERNTALPEWLTEITSVEHDLVAVLERMADVFDLLAEPISARVEAMQAAGEITVGEDALPMAEGDQTSDMMAYVGEHLDLLDRIQRTLRKQFRRLADQGIGTTLPPYQANIYAEEKQLDLSAEALHLARARVEAILAKVDAGSAAPPPANTDAH